MVNGIEQFKAFFAGFEDNYVIIGGTACEIHEEIYAQTPRATKDIDMILIVEALSKEFVARFWDFVKAAQYGEQNKGTVEREHIKHEYYRFMKPADQEYPYQVELFSRNLGLIDFPKAAHTTPIPVSEDLSSLSAILMNDDYYNFTINHSSLKNGIHIADIESLICLKCKAYLEMSERKARGEQIDSRQIAKHKKDVFRLVAMLGTDESVVVPKQLSDDIERFCKSVSGDLPNSDFRRIKSGNNPLTWKRFNDEHERCLAFLKDSITKSKAKHIIVATHHVPSYRLMADEFKGSPLNGAFTVELGNYIATSPVEYWIYGHSHRNIDTTIGRTHCVSNQLGYVIQNECFSFDTTKHIIVPGHRYRQSHQ